MADTLVLKYVLTILNRNPTLMGWNVRLGGRLLGILWRYRIRRDDGIYCLWQATSLISVTDSGRMRTEGQALAWLVDEANRAPD